MIDLPINELPAAQNIEPTDLFVLQQGEDAMSLPGQVLINWLTAAADGHGGINAITKIGSSGLVDTYRITLADKTTYTYTVTNGAPGATGPQGPQGPKGDTEQLKRCMVGQKTTSVSKPWFKFASIEITTPSSDRMITFMVSGGFGSTYRTRLGILSARLRTDANKNTQSADLTWQYAGVGINVNEFVLAHKSINDSKTLVELWVKSPSQYRVYFFVVLSEHENYEFSSGWTLYDTLSTTGYADEITPGYEQVISSLMVLQGTRPKISEWRNRVLTTAANQKVVTIGISDYNTDTDTLDVYINGLHQQDGTNYTKTATSITTTNGLAIGTEVCFVVRRVVVW